MNESQLKDHLLQRTLKMLDAKVGEVMTTEVRTCDAQDLSASAARIILENGFLGLLVLKAGKPLGMVTAFDLVRLSYEEVFDPNRDYLRTTVEDLIKDRPLITVESSAKVRDALNTMVENHVRTIPVVDDGEVKGVLSYVDMAKWYRQTHDEVRTGRL